MNERIRELAEQAGASYYNTYTGPLLSPKDIEEFAELIVRECADLVADDDNAFDVLKHFGIEE